MKVLLIAGHGKKKNGTFDPGASGFLKKGEHRATSRGGFFCGKEKIMANLEKARKGA